MLLLLSTEGLILAYNKILVLTGDTRSYPAAPLLLLLSTEGLLLAYHMILIGGSNLNKPAEPLSAHDVREGKGEYVFYSHQILILFPLGLENLEKLVTLGKILKFCEF